MCVCVCVCVCVYIYIYIYIYIYKIRNWFQKLKLSKYFKELIFNTLLFADNPLISADTENNLQRAVYLLYKISKEYNL